MCEESRPRGVVRAGTRATVAGFELDRQRRTLERAGRRVRIQELPLRILEALVERPGEVVSREALRQRLWPDGTHVDFDRGLTVAVHKLREALGDCAADPRIVATVSGVGYRLLVPVGAPPASDGIRQERSRGRWAFAAACAAAAAVAVCVSWSGSSPSASATDAPERTVAVLPLRNTAPARIADAYVDAMTDILATALGDCGSLRVVSSRAVQEWQAGREPDIAADALVEGAVFSADGRVRVTVRLVDVARNRSLWSGRYERSLERPLEVQSAVARAIAQSVKFTLLRPGESPPVAAAPDPWPG